MWNCNFHYCVNSDSKHSVRTVDSDCSKVRQRWHVAKLMLHCLIPHGTYMSVIVTSRIGFIRAATFYGTFPSTFRTKTYHSNSINVTKHVSTLECDVHSITLLAVEEMCGGGSQNTDTTFLAGKDLSAWNVENAIVRSLAFLPLFREFLSILSLPVSEKYSSVRCFKCLPCFMMASGI